MGVKVTVAVAVSVGVNVNVGGGVIVGPSICPGAHAVKRQDSKKIEMIAEIVCFIIIFP